MRLVIDKFEILTDKKINEPVKIVLMTDIHAGDSPFFSGRRNMNSTIRGLKKIKNVDAFALCGDFVNNALSWINPFTVKNFSAFLKKLANIAPVFLVKGNHDVYMSTSKTDRKYDELGKIKNVFLLDNKQTKIKGIKLTGFAPSHETYALGKHGKRAQKIAVEDFRTENFKFSEKDFNIILTHSPYSLMNKVAIEKIPRLFEKCDVILSGHLHNGLLPSRNFEYVKRRINKASPTSRIRKFIVKNIDWGIWFDPKTGFMISHCRGAKMVGDGEIGRVILPSSREPEKIPLSKDSKKLTQITSKAVNKYPFLPLIDGRPSIVELSISHKD